MFSRFVSLVFPATTSSLPVCISMCVRAQPLPEFSVSYGLCRILSRNAPKTRANELKKTYLSELGALALPAEANRWLARSLNRSLVPPVRIRSRRLRARLDDGLDGAKLRDADEQRGRPNEDAEPRDARVGRLDRVAVLAIADLRTDEGCVWEGGWVDVVRVGQGDM